MADDQSILVSICCITYNHAPFIRKALDGFLMQQPPSSIPSGAKMSDWCEILIHDDCSNDGTTEIIKEYAAKYPNLIYPLYEEENQYSKIGTAGIDFFNYNRARGKYIAYCEGDDYWTESNKLQKQVDFMEVHPDYSLCMHGCSVNDVRSGKQYTSSDFNTFRKAKDKNIDGMDFTARDYLFGQYGQPLSLLFRLSMLDFNWYKQYKHYRDTNEIYLLLCAGKGYWMNFNGGVYTRHDGGVYTSGSLFQHVLSAIECVDELYYHNRFDKNLRDYLSDLLLWCYNSLYRNKQYPSFWKMWSSYLLRYPVMALQVIYIICKRKVKYLVKK